MADQTLAQVVRAKFPDAYKELSDQQLESAVVAKFPGVYDHVPRTGAPTPKASTPTPTPAPSQGRSTLADIAVGAGKGLSNTVIGLGEMANRWVPGVSRVNRAIHGRDVSGDYAAARTHVQPTNTAQRAGFMAEQIGEFFVPGGAVARAAKGSRAARAGLELATATPLASAQGATRSEAGLTGALSAAVPGVSAVRAAGRGLRQSAEKNVAQALGATKEWAKVEASKLAPGMIDRGVGGSRRAMLDRASQEVTALGAQINKATREAADAGATIDAGAISGYLATARQALSVQTAKGTSVPIPGTERVVRQLDKLDTFVESLGPQIPFDRAAKIKTTWDHIVSKAGLYGQKATANATDSADAWAVREAASGFRRLLADGSATLDDLNREFAFWKGLKNVLKETEKRTQTQGGGLVSGIGGVAGVATGVASGDSAGEKVTNAIVYGAAGRQLIKLFQSPQFRTQVSAPLKDKLAHALARNDVGLITSTLSRITATLPSTAR